MRTITLINTTLVILCLISIFLVLRKTSVVAAQSTYFRVSDAMDLGKGIPLANIYIEALPDAVQAESLEKADFVFFQTFNRIDQQIKLVGKHISSRCVVNGMNGTDLLVSKSILAKYIKGSKYSPPNTYVLSDPEDFDRFRQNIRPDEYYFLKKNIQRQQGMFIGQGDRAIEEAETQDGYVVAQRMLDDPFLLSGRKVNLRFYLIVIIRPGQYPEWILFDDGFVYYTPKMYKEDGPLDKDSVVTSGYVDRKVYQENPLSLSDFFTHIGPAKTGILMKNVRECFAFLESRYTKDMKLLNASIPGVKFSIFGCDVAPDKDLGVTLMEINKGPDLNYKDDRDKNVKLTMVKNLMQYLA